MCVLQEGQVSKEEDKRQNRLLQKVIEEDSLLMTAPRKRRSGTLGEYSHTNDNNTSSAYQTERGLSTTDMHVENLEARLARMEDLLAKILVSLKIKDGVTLKKTQSTNDLFVSTSYV